MEDEVFEEVFIDDSCEVTDSVELVDSVEEIEEDSTFSQDELISALLSVLNEHASQEEDASSDPEEIIVNEVTEVTEVEPQIDYTDILTSMDSRLFTLEEQALVPDEVYSIDTPLNQYKLDSFLLVIIFIVTFVNFGYQIIKDNLLHF